MQEQILHRQLARAKAQVAALEHMIEEKTRSLFLAKEQLVGTTRFLEDVLATIRSAVFVLSAEGRIHSVNRATTALTGYEREHLEGAAAALLLPHLADLAPDTGLGERETTLRAADGTEIPVLFASSPMKLRGAEQGIVCVAHDLRAQKRLELGLRQAQKLESVGQLAAGVAHEINTPIQFAGDSVEFLAEAFAGVTQVLDRYDALCAAAAATPALAGRVAAIRRTEAETDLEFLRAEIPGAVARAKEGVGRVARIVKAMKAFAYIGGTEKAPHDLNEAIRTTLEVSRNEFKYVAREELDLGELPPVLCNLGDINQVILNLVVNAAHAIQDRVAGSGDLGALRIRSRRDGDFAVVEVEDTGTGIPPAVQPRIFDPFFTTKEVGRGTGQGLAISRNVVVDKHGGTLTFETRQGVGTTFRVRLPIRASQEARSTKETRFTEESR